MYGKNPVRKQAEPRPETLDVKEIFATIQGEGPSVGRPAIFVRLAGCNLRCHFCDTDFEGGERKTPQEVVSAISKALRFDGGNLVVFTGGEPMRQDFAAVMRIMNTWTEPEMEYEVETAGTVWFESFGTFFNKWRSNRIIVSPKTPRVHEQIRERASAWKYLIRAGEIGDDGLPVTNTQVPGAKRVKLARPPLHLPPERIFVQPVDEGPGRESISLANRNAATDTARRYGFRLSLQTHKILGLP